MSKADRIYHILNGDALLERFPSTIEGEKIVFRECLVDGPLQGDDMDALLMNRCTFLTEMSPLDFFKHKSMIIRKLGV